jgi:hypothetical protein
MNKTSNQPIIFDSIFKHLQKLFKRMSSIYIGKFAKYVAYFYLFVIADKDV